MAFNQTDNFFASNDHIVRTSREWDDSAIANYPIPRGVLCVEITPKNHTRLKVGEGDKYYHQLPYIDGDAELSNYYTKQEVDNIITNLNYMSIASTTVYESRNALPKTGNRLGDLRFVKNPNQGLEDPIEYIWNGKKWVLVGGGWTEVDLSGYAKKSEVNPRLDRLEAQAHTHKNKTVLDNTTASYTLEEKSKLTTLHNYDDAPIQRRVSSLEEKAHTHVNKEILDDTTAAFTREEKTKLAELENYSDFVGTDGTGDGTHGLVPAPQSTDANKYLSSDGTWKSVAAGSIEPATADTLGGVKIGSGVNVTQDGTISVTPYDDTAVRQDITALQASAHTHSNKSVLDNTTASYTIAEQTKLAGLENYTLPVASANTLGGIKVGDGLSIDQDGILSADGSIEYRAGAGISIETASSGDPSTYDTTHPYYSDTQTSAILDCPGRRRTYTRTTTNPAYVVISRVKNTGGSPDYWYTVYVISKNINDTLCNFLDSDHFSGRSSTADVVSVTIDGTTWYGNGYMISLGDIDPVGDVNEVVPYFESEETSAADTVAAILDYIYSDDTSKYIVNTGVLDVTKNASGNLVVSKESGDTTITLPQEYTLPIASANDLGGVIIGDGVNVAADGTISVTPYSLPTASASTLGGIKVGTGLAIDQNGVLSATGGGGGEGYSETELISAPIVGSVSSITLLDSMQNYDALTFEFGITADNLDQQFVRIVPVSDLDDTGNAIFLDGLVYAAGSNWGVGYSVYKTSDTTLHASYFGTSSWSESGTIFSIKGIKYGDGGGGGSKEYLAGEGISITERSEEHDTPVDISSEHWVNESPTNGGSRYTISTNQTYLLQRYSLAAGTSFKVKFVPTNPTDIIYYGFDSYPSNSDSTGGIVVIGQTGPVDGFEVDQSKTYTMPADRNSLDVYIRINDTHWTSSDVVSAASFTELKLIITDSTSQGTFIDANVRDGLEIDPDDNTINVTPATTTDIGGIKVGAGLAIDANGVLSTTGGGGQEYIAGEGISIVTGGQIVTDLSSANWENYADMYDGQRSPTYDSRTFKLRYLHIEPGTQFKIKLTPADPNDTIYWYLYGYENDAATTGGLHFGQSSDPNDWDTDCDYVYTMPTGKSSLDITVRINNTQYGYGDVVTLSKFDEMQYITGTGPTTKTINVTPATTQAIGGVIVGNGLNITQQGVLSLNQLELHCTQNPSS